MYIKVVSTAALLVGGLVGFNALTNVTELDIVMLHDLQRPVGAAPMRPGDIVALSPDGLRMERICSLNLTEDKLDSEHLAYLYVNSLRENLPAFASVVKHTVDAVMPGSGAAKLDMKPDGIAFTGRISTMMRVSSAPDMIMDCECEMARRLNAREPVCTVNASLVEMSPAVQSFGEDGRQHGTRARTVAVTFARRSNLVPERVFQACGLDMSDAAVSTMALGCGGEVRAPVDTRMRHWLNVIDKRGLPQQTVSAGGGAS